MPYTPPTVTTDVVIDSTTVSLPGGTRILSLIGNAIKTKTVLGEFQIQPSGLDVEVNQSGLSSVLRVYDFSGPGNSLYTYPTSGNGAYSSGYYISGDEILWTPAENLFPISTTPAIGDEFVITYSGGATENVIQNSGRDVVGI